MSCVPSRSFVSFVPSGRWSASRWCSSGARAFVSHSVRLFFSGVLGAVMAAFHYLDGVDSVSSGAGVAVRMLVASGTFVWGVFASCWVNVGCGTRSPFHLPVSGITGHIVLCTTYRPYTFREPFHSGYFDLSYGQSFAKWSALWHPPASYVRAYWAFGSRVAYHGHAVSPLCP